MNTSLRLALSVSILCLAACGGGTSGYANNPQAVGQFAKDVRGNRALLVASLPSPAETAMICASPEDAKLVDAYVAELAKTLPAEGISGDAEQTEVLVKSTTTAALRAGTDQELSGGYTETASRYKDGLDFYAFSYVKPGESLGVRFDACTHVNGRLVFVPKMWRAFR